MTEITLIRHAQSQSNIDGIWNGRSDGPLSVEGRATLEPLGRRLRRLGYDVVVSSPLQRALDTARSFSDAVEIDPAVTEIDLGQWEGMSRDEISRDHGEYLKQAVIGGDEPMGYTGESLKQVRRRAVSAVQRLAERIGPEGKAAVVSHGGFIQAVLNRYLDGRGRRVHAFVANTSLQRFLWSHDHPRLATFNDTGHLGAVSAEVSEHLGRGETVFALIRHGRTAANVQGRWQGQSDWGLDSIGVAQASALRDWYGQFDTVYSSPVGRAHDTAKHLAVGEPIVVDGLKEIDMGRWEGLTSDEIFEGWPDLMTSVFRDGVDLRRGENGESWGELGGRFRRAVHGLPHTSGVPTVVVAHGGAIRCYVSSLTETLDSHSESLHTPANTSVSHIAMAPGGPLILDYAVSTHLETLS